MSLERRILEILYWIAYGVVWHDAAHQVWELKGTVLSWEGVYVGLVFLGIIGFTLLHTELATKLAKKVFG